MKRRHGIRDIRIGIVADWFGLRQREARLLLVLYDADGPLSRKQLICRIHPLTYGALGTAATALRAAIGAEAFPKSSRHGTHYHLTESGRRDVQEAFENAAKELAPNFAPLSRDDEIMVLRDALGLTYAGNPEWGLEPKQMKILGIIANTAMATNERIRTAMWGMEANPPGDEVLRVQICKMRPKLARHGIFIETKWGEGYYLTPESRAIVRAAA